MQNLSVSDVKKYWESNPVAAAAVPYEPGTREFFQYYDLLREEVEPVAFSYALHEYADFKGKKVLDVGCGNGYVLSRYAREGADVYGVDITSKAIELTRQRFQLGGLQGTFDVANAEALPFGDGEFDCVCSMGVLHHTPNTAAAVAEIHRVLKPGGRLIIMMYHRNSALYRFRFQLVRLLRGRSISDLVNEVDGVGNPKGDVYTRRELAVLLHAFKDVSMSVAALPGYMLLPKVGHLIPKWFLRLLEPHVGWFLYAKARA